MIIDYITISTIAAELGVSWRAMNSIAMAATAELVAAAGPDRLVKQVKRAAGSETLTTPPAGYDFIAPANSLP